LFDKQRYERWQRLRRFIFQRDRYCCRYCSKALVPGIDEITIDHVVARARGGTSHPKNLVTACKRCNFTKKDLTVFQFKRMLASAQA
jgi:5-methylcytosine-specific restriction endonuclease McrA